MLDLPALFVCENNGYGEYTPTDAVTAGEIGARAEAMKVPTADGGRDGRLGRARRGARSGRAGPQPGAGRCSSRPGRTASSATPAATPASTGRRESSTRWQERDPLLIAEQRLVRGARCRGRTAPGGGGERRTGAGRGRTGRARGAVPRTGGVRGVQGVTAKPGVRTTVRRAGRAAIRRSRPTTAAPSRTRRRSG